MKNQHQEHVIGIPVSSSAFPVDSMNKLGKKADSFVNGVREHGKFSAYFIRYVLSFFFFSSPWQPQTWSIEQLLIVLLFFFHESTVRLATNMSETVKRKLSLGARILQVGGVEKIFKQHFRVREGEKLLKASQCYLSTTAGPIAGLLFISDYKIAFCSERAIKLSSADGELFRIHYKVIIMHNSLHICNIYDLSYNLINLYLISTSWLLTFYINSISCRFWFH